MSVQLKKLSGVVKISIVMGFIIVALILSQSGCTPLFDVNAAESASKSLVDIQSEVNTAVAATLVSLYVAETQSAAMAVVVASTEPPTAVPPTPTAVPPQPTPTFTAIPPTVVAPGPPAPVIVTVAPVSPPASTTYPAIWASINTNCRLGPSTMYPVDGYLTVGITSYVHGTDSAHFYWYIEHPQRTGQFCWVWTSTTHVEGDTNAVPVVAASPAPQTVYNPWLNYGYNYSYYYPYSYGYGCGSPYPTNCYCPCKTKKLTCNQKKKWWCYINWTCPCKMTCPPCNPNPCHPPQCYPNPCNNPQPQVVHCESPLGPCLVR